MMLLLNGRPARRFIWTISEREFCLQAEEPDGSVRLLEKAATWGQLEKALGRMLALGLNTDKEFRLTATSSRQEELLYH